MPMPMPIPIAIRTGRSSSQKSLRITGPLLAKLSMFIRKKIARQQKIVSNRAAAQLTKAKQAKLAAVAAAAAAKDGDTVSHLTSPHHTNQTSFSEF